MIPLKILFNFEHKGTFYYIIHHFLINFNIFLQYVATYPTIYLKISSKETEIYLFWKIYPLDKINLIKMIAER